MGITHSVITKQGDHLTIELKGQSYGVVRNKGNTKVRISSKENSKQGAVLKPEESYVYPNFFTLYSANEYASVIGEGSMELELDFFSVDYPEGSPNAS